MRLPPINFIAYDPAGDGDDDDAIVLMAREEHQRGEPWDPDYAVQMKYRVRLAYTLPQGMEFVDKLAVCLSMHKQLMRLEGEGQQKAHFFCVEANGVGWGIASALRSKISSKVVTYTTVANATENPFTEKRVAMPRLAALDNLRILIETHHMRIEPDAPGADMLMQQLNAFVWRRAGRPEAIEGQKDDLVMALTGAAWIASRLVPPQQKAITYRPHGRIN
jgi:hypothetical protein